MANRRFVDLNEHINKNQIQGSVADFEVEAREIQYLNPRTNEREAVPNRRVLVRKDSGVALEVVSNRYTIVKHTDLLQVVEDAIKDLGLTDTPKGLYVTRGGSKLRALYKFPELRQDFHVGALDRKVEELCPMIQVQNIYDGTGRIQVSIGAFSFVCTNFAIGGSGAFDTGFMSVHAGVIDLKTVAERLKKYLNAFDEIVELYRFWAETRTTMADLETALKGLPERHIAKILRSDILQGSERQAKLSVFDGYNAGTRFLTHDLRSANRALDLISVLNKNFQESWKRPNLFETFSASLGLPKGEIIDVDFVEDVA